MNPARLRLRTLLLAALLMIACAHPSHAIVPVIIQDDGTPAQPDSPSAACALEPGPPAFFATTWQDPGMWYSIAWRLPQCSACAFPQGLNIRTVQFRVRWIAACSATAHVTIIGTRGDPLCPEPDTTRVLCGPVSMPISGTNSSVTYTVAMPQDCCVFEDAFVRVQFDGFLDCRDPNSGLGPGLTASNVPCVDCTQYIQVVEFHPDPTDHCAINNPIWLHVDADCCAPTPAHPKSWGRVKTLYR